MSKIFKAFEFVNAPLLQASFQQQQKCAVFELPGKRTTGRNLQTFRKPTGTAISLTTTSLPSFFRNLTFSITTANYFDYYCKY